MNDEIQKGFIQCEECGRLIPKSAALTAEGKDYTYYFCGIECYEKWKEEYDKRE